MPDESAGATTVHPWVAAGQGRIRFGVGLGAAQADWPAFLAGVRLAEALGIDSVWVADHPTERPDCWATLAALAVSTTTIRLGTLVACVYYRHPALLARLAADVDRLSAGRLILGLGIGDDPDEFARLALPFPPARERQEALEEALQIVVGAWQRPPFTFASQHFQVRDLTVPPGPAQRPHVPVLIAGGGERVTLRQVAEYGDMANFGPHPWTGGVADPAGVRRKLAALRGHCAALGRPYEAILRSHIAFPLLLAEAAEAVRAKVAGLPPAARAGMVAGTPAEAVVYYRALVEAGMQYFLVGIRDEETLRLLGERVLPALTSPGGE